MSESEDTIEFSKKRKRNDKEGQDPVLSFQELKSYFDKKFKDVTVKIFCRN